MNIFRLNNCPKCAAKNQCDQHIRKMYIESAQMLCTTHRMCDGFETKRPSKSGKTIVRYWEHPDLYMEENLYAVVHRNHPSTVWTRESKQNYIWHYEHFIALLDEYTFRRGTVTKTDIQLRELLKTIPSNIPNIPETPFKLAMADNPECMFPGDPVKSYRLFYKTKTKRIDMQWTRRERPDWWDQYEVA